MPHSDVLIIGAGPTGLVLALWLSKLGISVRILDRTSAAGTTSRALAVQARTLELYRQLDLADAVVGAGHQVPAANLWVKGEPAARLPLDSIGANLTPYPFLEIYPQDQHENLLIERLRGLGVEVERSTELLGFTQHDTTVSARLRLPDGSEQDCEAHYLAGCDGAHSAVRNGLHVDFPGGTYQQLFYVADVDAAMKQAVAAGAQVTMPVADMFWGDRYGQVVDPCGHRWSIATHKFDLTPQEVQENMAKMGPMEGCGDASKKQG